MKMVITWKLLFSGRIKIRSRRWNSWLRSMNKRSGRGEVVGGGGWAPLFATIYFYSGQCQSSKPVICRKRKAMQGLCGWCKLLVVYFSQFTAHQVETCYNLVLQLMIFCIYTHIPFPVNKSNLHFKGRSRISTDSFNEINIRRISV